MTPDRFAGDLANMRTAGGATLDAARRLDFEIGEIRKIQQQQFTFELPG